MRRLFAISLGGLLALGCGGGGLGLSGGNSKPRVVDVLISPALPQIPIAGGLLLYPDIADEKPGSCTVSWTLKVWSGAFNAVTGEPILVDAAPGTDIGAADTATKATTGEAESADYDIVKSGWFTVIISITDPGGIISTSTWDFGEWCQVNGFGQCPLLPVGDQSDNVDPTLDVTQVVLKGTVEDEHGGTKGVTSLTGSVGTVVLASPDAAVSAFTATIDCPGQATVGTPVVTSVTLTATDVETNSASKDVTITEQIP